MKGNKKDEEKSVGNVSGRKQNWTSTKKLVIIAFMTALTTAFTLAVRIPTIATEGYVNLGDTVLLFSGVVFGPVCGLIAGGLGSCLADLAGGYAHWILPTFIIKGIEGFVVGLLFILLRKLKWKKYIALWFSMTVSVTLMVVGYFFASFIMKGSAAVALTSVPENCLQALFSVILCFVFLTATGKVKGVNRLVGENYFFTDVAYIKNRKMDGASSQSDNNPAEESMKEKADLSDSDDGLEKREK